MKKYQLILILFLVLLYSIFFYFDHLSKVKGREVYLSDLNKSIIDIAQRITIDIEMIYPSSYTVWGLNQSKLLKERENKIDENREQTSKKILNENLLEKNVNLSKRVICIDRRCWEFMGVIKLGNQISVTLLSKDKKPKLKTVKVGDELLEGLIICNIKGDSMTVEHIEKKERFTLKLFDIDIKPYLPKKTLKDNHE
jgi:hypothetical protein